MDLPEIVELYKKGRAAGLNQDLMNVPEFVLTLRESGLLENAWRSHERILDIAGTHESLLDTWESSKAFLVGTLKALERDLPDEHPLRQFGESGDESLPDIWVRLNHLTQLLAVPESSNLAWQSFWLLNRSVWDAAQALPRVSSLHSRGAAAGVSAPSAEAESPVVSRATGPSIAPASRPRKNALPYIHLPDPRRVCTTLDSVTEDELTLL